MGRRLAAALLILALGGCGEDKVGDTRPAPPPAKAVAAPKLDYAPTKSPTLDAVRKRGWLSCGVHSGLPGFAYPDVHGAWRGFDVDICRAVAAAALGDASKVRFVVVGTQDRFAALRAGKFDMLSRNSSWTFSRDAGLGLDFPAVTYFDGQGFLVPRALKLASAGELAGAMICVLSGTTNESNLADYFRARGLEQRVMLTSSEAEARRLYQEESCEAYTADVSALASARSVMNNPGAHVILPDVISKEPLGPVVRQDDPAWTDIVRWTVYAMIIAEERGVSSRTVDAARRDAVDPETRRLLGVEGGLGPMLGLSADWAYQVIRQVGSYDEVFERNLGAGSPLKLDRGLNALWNAHRPGLLYAPPIK